MNNNVQTSNSTLNHLSNTMENHGDRIVLWRQNNRKGAAILRRNYEIIANSIVSEIQSNEKNEIDLWRLIDKIRYTLSSRFNSDIDWYFLQVKQDLEARGAIKTTINRDHVQTIALTKNMKVLKG